MDGKAKTYLILGLVLVVTGVIGLFAGGSTGVCYGSITTGIALEALSINECKKNNG